MVWIFFFNHLNGEGGLQPSQPFLWSGNGDFQRKRKGHGAHIWLLSTSLMAKINWPRNKVSLQTSLERNSLNFSYISFLGVNFENLTVEFYVSYVFNMHIKFRSNRILFTIWLINLFFIYNFRLQKLEIITFIWWHSNWSLIFLNFFKH